MKRILIATIIALLASSSVYAADTSSATTVMDLTGKTTTGLSLFGHDTTATATTPLIGKTSSGVGVAVFTSVNGYAVATQHLNGSKAFASSYDSTALYSEDVATVGTVELGTLTAIDTGDFSDWKAL